MLEIEKSRFQENFQITCDETVVEVYWLESEVDVRAAETKYFGPAADRCGQLRVGEVICGQNLMYGLIVSGHDLV